MSVKKYNTKFKKIVVSGCSYTHNNCESPHVWANLLATWLGIEIVNLATPGAGNDHIANSIILYLDQNTPDPDTTLVMAMWSSVDRSDFLASTDKHSVKLGFNYNQYSSHYRVGGSWPEGKAAEEFKMLQSVETLAMKSWLDFTNLTNYLVQNDYTYRYLTFVDILNGTSIMSDIKFLSIIKNLNIKLNNKNWLLTKDKDTLGQFCIYMDMMLEDCHPTREGQELWTDTVLIPALIKENICYER